MWKKNPHIFERNKPEHQLSVTELVALDDLRELYMEIKMTCDKLSFKKNYFHLYKERRRFNIFEIYEKSNVFQVFIWMVREGGNSNENGTHLFSEVQGGTTCKEASLAFPATSELDQSEDVTSLHIISSSMHIISFPIINCTIRDVRMSLLPKKWKKGIIFLYFINHKYNETSKCERFEIKVLDNINIFLNIIIYYAILKRHKTNVASIMLWMLNR